MISKKDVPPKWQARDGMKGRRGHVKVYRGGSFVLKGALGGPVIDDSGPNFCPRFHCFTDWKDGLLVLPLYYKLFFLSALLPVLDSFFFLKSGCRGPSQRTFFTSMVFQYFWNRPLPQQGRGLFQINVIHLIKLYQQC